MSISKEKSIDERRIILNNFYIKHRRMPSFGEMMSLFGYKTKSAVAYMVSKLIKNGIVYKDKTGKLIPKNLGEVKILGLVEAGFPSHAEEELIDTISLDEYLIENSDASFILRVKGDSMIDAGIVEGDLIIVERGRKPKVGDIVIAYIDGGYTMKYFKLKNQKPILEPANHNYKPMVPKEELKIEAVVTGVVRKYKN
jgi:SOS regulatory protein LexA